MMFVLIFVALCVSTSLAVDSYRLNATEAKEGDIPYIALIKVKHPHTGNFMPICHGTIISEYDILTNAICASACRHPPNCKLYVGRVRVNSGGIELTIKSTVWHKTYYELEIMKNYSEEDLNQIVDIGIIHTVKIQMSATVQVIVGFDLRNGNQTVTMAGWGAEKNKSFKIQPKVNRISSSWLFASLIHFVFFFFIM